MNAEGGVTVQGILTPAWTQHPVHLQEPGL